MNVANFSHTNKISLCQSAIFTSEDVDHRVHPCHSISQCFQLSFYNKNRNNHLCVVDKSRRQTTNNKRVINSTKFAYASCVVGFLMAFFCAFSVYENSVRLFSTRQQPGQYV